MADDHLLFATNETGAPEVHDGAAPALIAQIADASDALLRRLDVALPLRSEHARATAFALVACAQRMGRDPESLTLREVFQLATESTTAAADLVDAWFAIGKMDGAWFAVGRGNRLNPSPLVLVDRGRRRRLLDAMLFANARAFSSEQEARLAGKAVFERTYVRHVTRASAFSASRTQSSPA